jgi:molecular chaperone DnaK
VRKALDTEDIDDIKAKTDILMQASHKLAEAVYQQAQQQSQTSGDGTGGGQPGGDETVEEGDYEVIDDDEQK